MQTKRCSKRGLMAMRENLLSIPYSARVFFFSLPTQEFFRGQGKIKVGRETKKHIK